MTIKEAILARLERGQASMNAIDIAVVCNWDVPVAPKVSIRARVYSLMKAGKVRRVRRGVYALVTEKIRWSAPHQDPTSW